MSEPAAAPVRLAASLEGPAGAPVLVLGNSLGTSCAVWEPQRAVLRRHFRLLRYEHRGHGSAASAAAAGTESGAGATGEGASPGRSPALPGPYTIAELGADVLALLDSRGIGRAMYCGASLGGMIGMWLAANAAMDLRPVLARITAPTLVISAAEDPATPPWHGAVIASGISGARLAVIRGAAHLANVSVPGQVTAALLDHLRDAAEGRGRKAES
jgi:pimeloyl-ACP methyl ester carboxylesterase